MNQPWMVSVGDWERKIQETYIFQYSAAKHIKQAFTQTINVTLKGISLSRWTKFYPERSIKLGSGVGGRERIRALCGEGLCVPYINEKKKSCLWQKASNLLSFSLLDVCYPTIKSAGSISFPVLLSSNWDACVFLLKGHWLTFLVISVCGHLCYCYSELEQWILRPFFTDPKTRYVPWFSWAQRKLYLFILYWRSHSLVTRKMNRKN